MSEPGLRRLGCAVAEAQETVLQRHGCLPQVRDRLLSHPSRRGLSPSYRRLIHGFLAAGAVLALVWMLWPRHEELSFEVAQRPGILGHWLAPAGGEPLMVAFSDGTQVRLQPRSGARVQGVDQHGARILLEHGHARFDVVPRPHASWVVEAGPFRIRVLGTCFQLSWDPPSEQLELRLERGTIQLSGPVLGSRVLRSGESVRVRVAEGQLQLASGKPLVAPERKGEQLSPPPKAAPPVRPRITPHTPKVAARGRGTVGLVRSGQYRAALSGAQRQGWASVLHQAPATTLQALADAARLAGEHQRSIVIYRTLRRRFPGTDPAALAAFSLGRLAFDQQGAHRKAANWFETYLEERPDGALAREALGRLLEARHLAGDRTAHQAARRYLERFPKGPHARLARTLAAQSEGQP